MQLSIASRIIFLISSVLFLSSCVGGNTIQILEPSYEDIKVYNTSITLLPLTEDIVSPSTWNEFISKHPESRSAVNDRNKELFTRYFSTVFEEVTTAKIVDGLDIEGLKVSFSVIDSSLKLSEKESLPYLIPENGKAIVNDTLSTDYTLMVQSLNWKVSYDESTSQAVGRASSSAYEVMVGFRYVLWNNRKNEVVAYGRLKKKSQYLQVPSKTTYIDILEELCRQIVTKSPLQEKKLYG